jgi:hypothetical protein
MLGKYAIYIIFCSTIFIPNVQAQEDKKIKFGAELNSHMSYSGINTGIQMNLLYHRHSLGIGIKNTYQNSYFYYQNALGIIIDYKYFLITKENIKAFISINYNNVIYKSLRQDATKNNIIHEYTFSNGYLIKLFKNCWIGNSIGIGGYTEQFYDYSETKYGSYIGYNVMFKGMISYEF